jgi:hypothetical protein
MDRGARHEIREKDSFAARTRVGAKIGNPLQFPLQ